MRNEIRGACFEQGYMVFFSKGEVDESLEEKKNTKKKGKIGYSI